MGVGAKTRYRLSRGLCLGRTGRRARHAGRQAFMKVEVEQETVLPELKIVVRRVGDIGEGLLELVPNPEGVSSWRGRDTEIVGWGTALELEFIGRHAAREAARVWDRLSAATEVTVLDVNGDPVDDYEGLEEGLHWPLALGSFGFAASTPGYLVVPEVTVIRHKDDFWVVTASAEETPRDAIAALNDAKQPWTKPTGLWTDPGRMTQSKWKEAVRHLIVMLQSGAASKVVLTRDLLVSASQPLDERYVLDALQRRYPTTWVYSVKGLIGATPEMLASLRNEQFVSRVLAGTSAPGEGEDLLSSMKNRTEHHLAVESVARAVAPLSESLDIPTDPNLLELPNVTHLSTDVRAVVKDSNVLDIVDALHPTAAVCGTPTNLAYSILENIEGTQRGRYSGPVGWIDGSGDGDFGIALRCGQLSEDREQIRVFAGGGIMPDSVPDLELAETRAKMRPLLEVLELER